MTINTNRPHVQDLRRSEKYCPVVQSVCFYFCATTAIFRALSTVNSLSIKISNLKRQGRYFVCSHLSSSIDHRSNRPSKKKSLIYSTGILVPIKTIEIRYTLFCYSAPDYLVLLAKQENHHRRETIQFHSITFNSIQFHYIQLHSLVNFGVYAVAVAIVE
jgi:hypothetical protein